MNKMPQSEHYLIVYRVIGFVSALSSGRIFPPLASDHGGGGGGCDLNVFKMEEVYK